MSRNPRAKNFRVLRQPQGTWVALLTAVGTFLDANDDKQEIPEADIRAVDPLLANDRIWNEVKRELGIED